MDDRSPVVLTDEARRIHKATLLIDGHNDLPGELRDFGEQPFKGIDIAKDQPQLQTDIPRLIKGGMGAQFWSAYVPSTTIKEGGGTRHALEQIDVIHRMIRAYPDHFELALTADDIERIHATGKIASLIGLEGGHAIEGSLGTLRMFQQLGVRYMTLTHSDTHDWADAGTDKPQHGGLSPFGEEVILEMNRLGMLIDISHVSPETMKDCLRISKAPLIASHSSAYTVAPHARNITDDVLRIIRDKGGVVMVNFFSGFIDPEGVKVTQNLFELWRQVRKQHPDDDEAYRAALEDLRKANPIPRGTIHTLIDHIDHIVKTAGIDHVGLGSDYDGVTVLPTQLEDVSSYPYITQALLDRGYTEQDIHKVMGRNVLRAMRGAEKVAQEWKD